jgi:hypothetical protein
MSKPKFKVGDRVVITDTNIPGTAVGRRAVGKITTIYSHFIANDRSFSEDYFDYIVKPSFDYMVKRSYEMYVNVREATAMDEVLCDEL